MKDKTRVSCIAEASYLKLFSNVIVVGMLGRVLGVSNIDVICFEPRALCLVSKRSISEPHNQLTRLL